MKKFLTIGLMSGTSMDGIDAALIETDGETFVKPLANISTVYPRNFYLSLKITEAIVRDDVGDLSKTRGSFAEKFQQHLQQRYKQAYAAKLIDQLCKQHALKDITRITLDHIINYSTQLHIEALQQLLTKTSYRAKDIAVIGYHGQTLFHRPSIKKTIQVGNGAVIADVMQIKVINNFRQQDVLAGGEGAPFAPLYHFALAKQEQRLPLAIVNCGGIANLTLLVDDIIEHIIAFDTGPGNCLLDRYVSAQSQGKEIMDLNGQYGLQGQVSAEHIDLLYQRPFGHSEINYYTRKPPKSLDVGDFVLPAEFGHLSFVDSCATLAYFTANSIVKSLDLVPQQSWPNQWVLVGGGWQNQKLLQEFKLQLPAKIAVEADIKLADEIGWQSSAIEAETFAYLAVRSLLAKPISYPNTTQVPYPMRGGELHEPN